MFKEQQISTSTDGWLFIKKQKKFKSPSRHYFSFIFPAQNNTFVAGGRSQLVHMDKDGNIFYRTKLNLAIYKAQMLRPHVLIGWSNKYIVIFDLNSQKKVEMKFEYKTQMELFPITLISDVFVFEQKLFSIILLDPDTGSTQIIYFNWEKVLEEEKFTPVHAVQLYQILKEGLVCKGDSKSKICWVPRISRQNMRVDLKTYEIQDENKGLLNIFPIQKEMWRYFRDLSIFKMWQYSPQVFSIAIESRHHNIKYFEYDIEVKKILDINQKLCSIQDQQSILKAFYHSQLLLTVFVTATSHYADFRGRKEDYSARVYFLKDKQKGFDLMYKFSFTEFKNHRCVEYIPNMFCLWHQDYNQNLVDINLWNVVSMKDAYVFFMAEDGMDLDDDLIWDAIRLLSPTE